MISNESAPRPEPVRLSAGLVAFIALMVAPAIVATTKRIFTERRHKLVESAGVELARGLLQQFPQVAEVRVRVMKLKPPIPERIHAAGVDLTLTREEVARGA